MLAPVVPELTPRFWVIVERQNPSLLRDLRTAFRRNREYCVCLDRRFAFVRRDGARHRTDGVPTFERREVDTNVNPCGIAVIHPGTYAFH